MCHFPFLPFFDKNSAQDFHAAFLCYYIRMDAQPCIMIVSISFRDQSVFINYPLFAVTNVEGDTLAPGL